LGKATKQSSTFGNNTANFAVDGDTKDRHAGSMFTTTNNDANAWWEVDLGANYDINQINIFNVTDQYKSRLQNLNIKVSKTPFTRNEDGQAFATNVFPDPVGNYQGNATGRYVRVYIGRKDYLNICEVQVIGVPAGATTPPSTGVAVGTATITDAPAPTVLPPAAPGFVRIQSKSTPDNYIHHQNTKPESGQIQASWLSGQWKVIYYGGGWVNYESRLKPGHYLNNNEGKLEVVKIAKNRSSALWKSLRINGDWVAIENSYSSNHFLHTKNGKIEIGKVQPSSSSALWKVK
jgi:hypothetical protein